MTEKETVEEAEKIMGADPTNYALRSCWSCNSAHEHLKQVAYVILCFECGHYFYKGVDLTFHAQREADR